MCIPAAGARAKIICRGTIVDGDTIEVGSQRVRLFGIDAPEAAQTCVANTEWHCGQQATFVLSYIIETHWVSCVKRDRDQYGRVVTVCHLSRPDGPDVNADMVREGWASAYRHYSTEYVPQEEQEGKAAHRGVCRGTLQAP